LDQATGSRASGGGRLLSRRICQFVKGYLGEQAAVELTEVVGSLRVRPKEFFRALQMSTSALAIYHQSRCIADITRV
jgi:hypothetical protein